MKTNVIEFVKRQREGIDEAFKSGVAFGRPKSIITQEFKHVFHRWKFGEMTAVKVVQEIGVKKATFYKLVKEYEIKLKSTNIL